MLGPARALALLCVSLGLGGGEDLDQELATLIETTNQLETFHLVYEVTTGGEEPTILEFIYSAPDRMRMRWSGEGNPDFWVEGMQFFLSAGDGDHSGWNRLPFPEPPSTMALLDDLFPPSGALGQGAYIDMGFAYNSETDKTDFRFSIACDTARTTLLGWLREARSSPRELSIDEQEIVCTGERHSFSVSRWNGILERVSIVSAAGESLEWRLKECFLNQTLDEDLLRLPDEARSAEINPDLAPSFDHLSRPEHVRELALSRVEHLLSEGRRTWDEGARDDWREVMEALHREWIPTRVASWGEELRQWIDEVDRIREQRAQHSDRAELAEWVAERREGLEEKVRNASKIYRDRLPAVDSEDRTPRPELLDAESEVFEELWDELVVQPLLDTFDEVVGAELDG
jgi:hypothetical protein